jgi:hypothetical protein
MLTRLRSITQSNYPAIGGALLMAALVLMSGIVPVHAQSTGALITGEIQRIKLADPADVWSNGRIQVGGQRIIIPSNLLIDLPANRLTLQQIFTQAPAACLATGESGLAKGDVCNTTGMGGIVTMTANITAGGSVIAGDVFIQKGIEAIAGKVTFINYNQGWFRLNGNPGDSKTGVMVRLNDPTGVHTVQRGLGCLPGSLNCSPDPRFTLDPSNYTNNYSSGYPYCIPSTRARNFDDVLGLGVTTAQANPDGTGDVLCPDTNRPPGLGATAADSRLFAPLKLGDSISAEGNFELIDGVQFLSAHTTMISNALLTGAGANQPDYLFLLEVEIDAPGFNNERVRAPIVNGFTTRPSDVKLWTIHYDPLTNSPHEFPFMSTEGCDNIGGGCGAVGIGAGANKIWKVRYDVDFLQPVDANKPELDPCRSLQGDPLFSTVCQGTTSFERQFAIMSPIPHEIMARTGKKVADTSNLLITLDVRGNPATNGEYLFPLGLNLGGIGAPEAVEIDLNLLDLPYIFEGIPWNLDRRLSPGGCIDTTGDGVADCEATPQPLRPFPVSELDPRTQAGTPTGSYNDPVYTASTLTQARDRIISYVTDVGGGVFNFNGDATRLQIPPVTPAARPIRRVPPVTLICSPPAPAPVP